MSVAPPRLDQPFSTIVADDEEPSLNGLIRQVRSVRQLELTGAYDNSAALLAAIHRERPEIVFLDVQMPSASGIEVARELEPSDAPVMVFVTAFDSYALEAFSVHACDYLLKPFDGKRFRQSAQWAITRAAQRRAAEQNAAIRRLLANESDHPVAPPAVAAGAARHASLERIAVKSEGRAHLVATRDVDWIEAVGSSCLLHVGGNAHRVARSISQLEASLPPQFARINRSTIVNLDQIRELQQLFHGRYTVVLRNGTELSLSRRYRRRARVLSDGL